MENITQGQLNYLKILFTKSKLWDEKTNIVLELTKNKSDRLHELTKDEASELIQKILSFQKSSYVSLSKLRKQVYAAAIDAGFGKRAIILDENRLNAFLSKSGAAKKNYKELDLNELQSVFRQMKSLKKNKMTK